MAEGDDFECGGYVNCSAYKEMRLRMMLTGTNAPTEEQWSAALTKLIDYLEKHVSSEPYHSHW